MTIHENDFLKSWTMENNIYPTVGGVLEPKNANYEGGIKYIISILCTHIIGSSGTQ